MSAAPLGDQSSPMDADRLVTDAWQRMHGGIWYLVALYTAP